MADFFDKVFTKYKTLIVVEDHKYQGSLCFELKNLAFNLGFKGKIIGINLEDRFFKPALLEDTMNFEGFSKEKLKKRISDIL